MIDSGKDFAHFAGAGSEVSVLGSWPVYLRTGLGVFIALAGCVVVASVWRVAGDEDRRQMIAAVRALEQARNDGQRVDAIRDLVRSVVIDGPMAIPPLIRSLADGAVEVRVEAARSLGPAASAAALFGSGDDKVLAATSALVNSLEDQEAAVRIAAVHALGSIAASKNPSGVIHRQTLVDALAAMLDDPDATVRASTIASLGVAGPVAAADPPSALIAALDDESSFNRAAAVRTLARFPQGVDRLIPALLAVLKKERDESPVRQACVEVLRQFDAERRRQVKPDPLL
jgi:HEAT repeat protein